MFSIPVNPQYKLTFRTLETSLLTFLWNILVMNIHFVKSQKTFQTTVKPVCNDKIWKDLLPVIIQ